MQTFKFRAKTYRVLEPNEIIEPTDIRNAKSNGLDEGWVGPDGMFAGLKADGIKLLIFARPIDSETAILTKNLTEQGYKKMGDLNSGGFSKKPPLNKATIFTTFVTEPSKDIFNWFAERLRHALLISVVVGTTTGVIYRKEIGRALPNVSISVKLPEILGNE